MFSRNIRLRRRWLRSNENMCLFCYQHLNNCFLSTSAHKSSVLPYKTRSFCWPGFLGLVTHGYKCFRLVGYSSVPIIGLSYLFSPVQGLDDNVTFIKHNLLHTCLCLFITLVFHSRNSLPCVFTHYFFYGRKTWLDRVISFSHAITFGLWMRRKVNDALFVFFFFWPAVKMRWKWISAIKMRLFRFKTWPENSFQADVLAEAYYCICLMLPDCTFTFYLIQNRTEYCLFL